LLLRASCHWRPVALAFTWRRWWVNACAVSRCVDAFGVAGPHRRRQALSSTWSAWASAPPSSCSRAHTGQSCATTSMRSQAATDGRSIGSTESWVPRPVQSLRSASRWRGNGDDGDGDADGGGGVISSGTRGPVDVLAFGAGGFGQLGCGRETELPTPHVLAGLGSLRVQATACGEYHSALLTAQGEVYTFGLGQYGVLGHGTADKCATPRRVERLIGEHVVTVACGWRHTAALTMQGALYSWGHGGFGQLGHGGTIDFYLPLRVKGGELWQQVACGWRHTGALARGGVAHTWGDGDQLQLGHGDAKMRVSPTAVDALFEVPRQPSLRCRVHERAGVHVGQ